MTNLILCLTLLNIGLSSQDAQVYNKEMKRISQITGLPILCVAYSGESYSDSSNCTNSAIDILLKFYNKDLK